MADYTREQLLHALRISQHRVIELLHSVATIQDWQPEPVEWSFRYIAASLAPIERTCHFRRVKRIASGENPHFSQYTTIGADFNHADLHESLNKWVSARQELVDFVKSLSEQELSFTGVHEPVGNITVLDALEEILIQDQGILRHVNQLIEAYYEEAM
jgi:hypothetical protein